MSEQPRPQDSTIIAVQKQEIDRVNDNRVVLIAMLEEMRGQAEGEIGRLHGVISVALGLLDDEGRAKVHEALNGPGDGVPDPAAALPEPSVNGTGD